MKTREAIDHYGSVKKLADALETWPQTVYAWGEYPPIARQYELEVKTQGKIKAEIKKATQNG
jgi:hypothetical protein